MTRRMGEREVAISYSGLKFARDSSNRDVITVNATKDQLKAAPGWKWENATTTPRQYNHSESHVVHPQNAGAAFVG